MPYEIYIVPQNPENPLIFMPLLPGQNAGTESYDEDNVYIVGVRNNRQDTEAIIFTSKMGSRYIDYVVDQDLLLENAKVRCKVTPEKKAGISLCDEDGEKYKMLVRHAGAAALNPKLN